MIEAFTKIYFAGLAALRDKFTASPPSNYNDVVRTVVQMLADGSTDHPKMDPERITEIDHGDYQGTLLYVIAAEGYQPSEYWYCKMSYGSCSHCDTLQSIQYDTPAQDQVAQYMTLALHVVQQLKKMGEDEAYPDTVLAPVTPAPAAKDVDDGSLMRQLLKGDALDDFLKSPVWNLDDLPIEKWAVTELLNAAYSKDVDRIDRAVTKLMDDGRGYVFDSFTGDRSATHCLLSLRPERYSYLVKVGEVHTFPAMPADAGFHSVGEMAEAFDVDVTSMTGIDEVLVADYHEESCNGSSYVLYRIGDMLFENFGSHCSCFGLEKQWDPEQTTVASIEHRLAHDEWEMTHCRAQVQQALKTLATRYEFASH